MTVDANAREQILKVARDAIGYGLVHAEAPELLAGDYPPALRQIACTFVTLHIDAALRGCIGSLRAHRPLVSDIAWHAYAAAFSDTRFGQLQQAEFADLRIHISILSPLQSLDFDCDDSLLSLLRPGVDGLLIDDGGQRATFLPTVWSSIPDGGDFLAALKNKAGMQSSGAEYKAWRYTTQDFAEASP
jgi:AmmeMemoRadiSam system protein A